MNRIIICDKDYKIYCPTLTWKDLNGFNSYPQKKFNLRNLKLEELKKETSCFVLHHSVTYNARDCHAVLVSRGLSCTFLIDDNDIDGYATLYQTLDVKEGAWSHAPLNNAGAGVEICYMPQAWENNNLYSEKNRKKFNVPNHEIIEDNLQGRKLKVFAPTKAQINTLKCLITTVCSVLDIPMIFPKDENHEIIKSILPNPKLHKGLLGHFNISKQKNDPAGLDLDYLEKYLEEFNQ